MLSRGLAALRSLSRREDIHGAVLLADFLGILFVVLGTAWAVSLWVLELDPKLILLAAIHPRIVIFLAVAAAMAGAAILWRRSIVSGEVRSISFPSILVPAALILLVLMVPRSAASQLGPETKVALFQGIIRQACEGDYDAALDGTKLITNSPRLNYFRSDATRFARYIEASKMVREAAEQRADERAGRMRIDELVAKSVLFGDKGQAAAMRRFNLLLAENRLGMVTLGRC